MTSGIFTENISLAIWKIETEVSGFFFRYSPTSRRISSQILSRSLKKGYVAKVICLLYQITYTTDSFRDEVSE